MDQNHPAAFRFARFLVRAAVVLTIVLIAMDLFRRVNDPGLPKPPRDEQIVQLKGRIAELELELERLRAENERLKTEAAPSE